MTGRFDSNSEIAELTTPLRGLLTGTVFGRYLQDYRLDRAAAIEFEIERLGAYSKDGQFRFAYSKDGRILGLIGFHYSHWDTELLEKRMAIVKYFLIEERYPYENLQTAALLLSQFHSWARDNGIEVVVMRLDSSVQTPIFLAQQEGYRFYECSNYLTLDLQATAGAGGTETSSRLATVADVALLKEIAAKQFFRRSHFFLDPGFTSGQAESIYSKWVESAMSQGQTALLYEESGIVRGVFLYEVVDLSAVFGRKFAVWKMAVVDSEIRGRGAGRRLFDDTIRACRAQGVDAIDSSYAVHNIASHNIHARLGFRLVNGTYTFHKWLD